MTQMRPATHSSQTGKFRRMIVGCVPHHEGRLGAMLASLLLLLVTTTAARNVATEHSTDSASTANPMKHGNVFGAIEGG